MKNTKYFNEIISLLKELHKTYPEYNLGKHLSTAFDGYSDVWGASDKELLFALEKYKTELELDIPHITNEEELEKIIKDGMNLFTNEIEEEEEEY